MTNEQKYKAALESILFEFTGIAPEDLTKAERNILATIKRILPADKWENT